jgi:hypothetical protein
MYGAELPREHFAVLDSGATIKKRPSCLCLLEDNTAGGETEEEGGNNCEP